MTQNSEPVLYIIVRNDLDSLNHHCGKVCAQVAHAANAMTELVTNYGDEMLIDLLEEWKGDRGFGVTIVLSAPLDTLHQIYDDVDDYDQSIAVGFVQDETYPLRDGKYTHLIPCDTCIYLFARKHDCTQYTEELNLMP